MHKIADSNAEFLTTAPAAREIGVSSQTVISWERKGKLPAIKTANGLRLFRREDVNRIKREREGRST